MTISAGRLAGAVGVVPAERVVFAIGPRRFVIAIDLVGRHHHRHAHAVEPAQRLQQVHRAHHIGVEGRARLAIARAHQRLGRQMKNDLRPRGLDEAGERRGIANIAKMAVGKALRPSASVKKVGRRRRRQADARSPRRPADASQSVSQEPLKPVWPVSRTRLPRQNEALGTFVNARFSMALCRMPRVLPTSFLSRNVSIGCQKPRCSKAIIWPMAASRRSASLPKRYRRRRSDRGTRGDRTKKPPLIMPPSPRGFSVKAVTASPSRSSAP